MSSLLAVVLVAKSALGAHLVYSYPPVPHPVPRTTKPIYHSARRQRALYQAYDSSSSDSASSSGSESDEEEDGPDAEQYLGFPDNVLAALLSPSRELCDQPFELVVDHLAFVGHPVWLGDDDVNRGRPMSVKEEVETSEEDDEDDEDDNTPDERRGRSRQPRYSDMSGLVLEDELELPESASRDQTIGPPQTRTAAAAAPPPRPVLIHPESSPVISPIQLARSQSSASTLLPLSSIASSQHSHTSMHGSGRLISFNFLCVIDTPPDSHLSSHLEGFYKDVIVPVTANIKALEKKDIWLGKEAAKLRRAREAALEKEIPHDEFLATLPARSPLAAAISQLFTSLKKNELAEINLGGLPVQVLLRGELPVEDDADLYHEREDYLLHDEGNDEQRHRSRSHSPGGNRYGQHRPAPLFSRMRRRPRAKFHPWQTLLLLEDPKQLQKDLMEGSVLGRFLDICRPTLSFAEYETLLDLDADDGLLEDIVDHLVHWKKARVIDVISLKGSYAISSDFERKRLPSLTLSFRSTFPSLPPLPLLLAHFSSNEPYSVVIPSTVQRGLYLNALVWLLRHEVVEKQRTYVRILVSEEIKQAAVGRWGGRKSSDVATRDGKGDVSALSTSASGTSDRSFGAAEAPRSRQSSVRAELDDTMGMAIVGAGLSGSSYEASLSRSAQSVLSMRAMRKRTTPTSQNSHGQRSNRLSAATFSSNSERPEEVAPGPAVIVEPGRPSMLESRWLSEVCRDKDKATVGRFEKCVRMFNGRHHLDEIRFRAQLSRKHFQTLLSTFEEHLILFTHS
ncbi:hypothetical protein JCM21900_005903 [Sporobolomyces salmonicolor]